MRLNERPRRTKPRDAPRMCFFDIETTDLVADFGTLLCCSWKFRGEKRVHTRKITDYASFAKRPWDDRALVRDVSAGLQEAEVLGSWYGKRFDVPFLNTRLLYHHMHPLPPLPHWDGWEVARYQMKMRRNRLASVSEFMGLDSKTPVRGDIWVKAQAGHGPSVKYIVDHCEKDVIVLEQAYERIKSLTKRHPNMTVYGSSKKPSCPVCGSERVQFRGTSPSLTRIMRRYQCQDCGKWSSSVLSQKPDATILRP